MRVAAIRSLTSTSGRAAADRPAAALADATDLFAEHNGLTAKQAGQLKALAASSDAVAPLLPPDVGLCQRPKVRGAPDQLDLPTTEATHAATRPR
jgi:uncharacterized membrane protein